MTPGKATVHRLLGGSTLFAALGALVVASATPASASPLTWGNAQAWVADGDLAAGHSTAVGFGGDSQEHATAADVFGPLADHAEINGESRALVDQDGARAQTRVEFASLRLTVDDLVELGMIDPPSTPDNTDGDSPSDQEPEPDSTEEHEDTEPSPESSEPPDAPEESPGDDEPEQDSPYEEPQDPDATESPRATEAPEENPEDPGMSDARTLPLSSPNEDDPEERAPRAADVDGEEVAIEFTVADLATSADAQYDGTTEADFEHGDITVFGEPVEPLESGEHNSVKEVVEIFDEEGRLVEEVPIGVHFVVNESTFEDDDEDWQGKGVRSWLTVWIQVGDMEGEDGFVFDLADSWALGSLYDGDSPALEKESGDEVVEENTSGGNLATTGSSLAALVTAAIVAVGGGGAATFLARKRTTAMDDRIED